MDAHSSVYMRSRPVASRPRRQPVNRARRGQRLVVFRCVHSAGTFAASLSKALLLDERIDAHHPKQLTAFTQLARTSNRSLLRVPDSFIELARRLGTQPDALNHPSNPLHPQYEKNSATDGTCMNLANPVPYIGFRARHRPVSRGPSCSRRHRALGRCAPAPGPASETPRSNPEGCFYATRVPETESCCVPP